MNLNEAKQILEDNGYLVESVELNFRIIDSSIRQLEKYKKELSELANRLDNEVFNDFKEKPIYHVSYDKPMVYGLSIILEKGTIFINTDFQITLEYDEDKKIKFNTFSVADCVAKIKNHRFRFQ